MIRVIALITAGFLFLSSLEAWGGFWLAGRWLISSRVASLTLGTVKRWLDRGIISSSTTMVKVFVNRNGKWILLTLALPEVIQEVNRLQSSASYCYIDDPRGRTIYSGWTSWGSLSIHSGGNHPSNFYSVSYSQPCYSGDAFLPAVEIRRWGGSSWWGDWAFVPKPGTYWIGQCQVTISLRVSSVCPSSSTAPPSVDWDQRREVPTRVYPNPSDFVRPDVIESDPSLRYLRDEYQRISQDPSIPTIPQDALSGVGLPSVGWTIPPEEALDSASEEGSTSPNSSSGSGSSSGAGSDSGSGSGSGSRDNDIDIPAIPGFDTSLNVPEKRAFPVELLNSIVQSHPLLRVLQGVNLDVGGGGECVIGSRPFELNFCQFRWVLNFMGALIVFVGFITGLVWSGRSE